MRGYHRKAIDKAKLTNQRAINNYTRSTVTLIMRTQLTPYKDSMNNSLKISIMRLSHSKHLIDLQILSKLLDLKDNIPLMMKTNIKKMGLIKKIMKVKAGTKTNNSRIKILTILRILLTNQIDKALESHYKNQKNQLLYNNKSTIRTNLKRQVKLCLKIATRMLIVQSMKR